MEISDTSMRTDAELADEIERILAEYHRAVELDDASLLPKIMSQWCDLFFKPGASAIIAALCRQPTEALKAAYFEGYEDAMKDRQPSSDQGLAQSQARVAELEAEVERLNYAQRLFVK